MAPILVRDRGLVVGEAPGPLAPSGQLPTLLFAHVPRTGGTTLNGILYREYGEGAFLKLEQGLAIVDGALVVGRDPLASLDLERRRRIGAVSGHMSVGLDRLLPGPARYLTLLRDPVERVISLYRYIRGNPSHPLHRRLVDGDLTLRDCLEQRIVQFNNGQIRMLTGAVSHERLGHGVDDAGLLDRAFRALEEQFDLVGTTPHFDDLLVLAWRRYRWQMPLYRASNAALPSVPPPTLDAETLDLAERMNAMDRALYTYAECRLTRDVQQAGTAFARDAALFGMLNASGGRT